MDRPHCLAVCVRARSLRKVRCAGWSFFTPLTEGVYLQVGIRNQPAIVCMCMWICMQHAVLESIFTLPRYSLAEAHATPPSPPSTR